MQQVTYLGEGEFAPYVEYDDLSLIIRKSVQRTSEILFCRVVSVWGTKPRRIRVERRVSVLKLAFVESGVSYARE